MDTELSIFSQNLLPRKFRKICRFSLCFTAKNMKFSIKDFFSKCDQIRRKSHLLKKSLMENFIVCAVFESMENHFH